MGDHFGNSSYSKQSEAFVLYLSKYLRDNNKDCQIALEALLPTTLLKLSSDELLKYLHGGRLRQLQLQEAQLPGLL